MMNQKAIIAQLKSLVHDAEAHRDTDGSLDDVFERDIEALNAAIHAINIMWMKSICDKYNDYPDCGNCPIPKDKKADAICGDLSFEEMIPEQLEYLLSVATKKAVVQEQKSKVKIGRPINGISLNGNEYLFDDDGNVMLFNSEEEAKAFLMAHGYAEKDIEDEGIVFVEVSDNGDR